MAEIECPHCEEAVLLDDGAYGLFDCPNCNNEFKWGRSYRPNIAVTIQMALSLLTAIGAGVFYWMGSTTDDGWGALVLFAFVRVCLIISCVLLLLALIVYFHQVTKPSKR